MILEKTPHIDSCEDSYERMQKKTMKIDELVNQCRKIKSLTDSIYDGFYDEEHPMYKHELIRKLLKIQRYLWKFDYEILVNFSDKDLKSIINIINK